MNLSYQIAKRLTAFLLVISFAGVSWASTTREDLIAAGASVVADPQTGQMRFIGFDVQALERQPVLRPAKPLVAQEAAAANLNQTGRLWGLANPVSETRISKHRDDGEIGTMTRFQQLVGGVPVIGGELIVNLSSDMRVRSILGKTTTKPKIDTTPRVTAEAATAVATNLMASLYNARVDELVFSEPALAVYDSSLFTPLAQPPALVWRFDIKTKRHLPINEFILVDAHGGRVVSNFNQAPRARNRMTYDASNVGTTGTLACDESNPSCTGGSADAVKAHTYAGNTYDYYARNFGRDSIDGVGMSLISVVRICPPGEPCPYENAYWNGEQMAYGQGFADGEDVVAHELTHGVTEYESNLIYAYQSGAINESLSDVFGEFVQQSNAAEPVGSGNRWLMGENLSIGAIRSMSDPTAFGDPDRMGSPLYHTASWDNGGVHINSGVNNKAAYLMVDGGSFNGRTVQPIGLAKAGRIYYRAQTNYLVSSSDYLDLYNALLQSCQDLVGTVGITNTDCLQVGLAAEAVEMNGSTASTFALSVQKTGAGTVTSGVADGIDCGATCSKSFSVGATVTLTANPGAGQLFLGWSGGGCTGIGQCVVVMSAARSVTASFGPGLRITLNAASNLSGIAGTWSPIYNFELPVGATNLTFSTSGGTGDVDLYVRKGAAPTLSTYDCASASVSNDEVCADPAWTAGTYYAGLHAYEAYSGVSFNVSYVRQPLLAVSKTGAGSGTVTSNVGGITCGSSCSANITGGSTVVLTARPTACSQFTGWSGACAGMGTCVVNMASDLSVTAAFATSACRSVDITSILMLLLD